MDRQQMTVYGPGELLIGIGHSAKRSSAANKRIGVKKIYTMPDTADDFLKRDVALLELSEETDVQRVELPESSDAFPNLKTSNLSATAVGYGFLDRINDGHRVIVPDDKDAIDPFDMKNAYELHYGDEIIIDDATAVNLFLKYAALRENNNDINENDSSKNDASENDDSDDDNIASLILGVISPDGKRATEGDSGGPLLLTLSGQDNNKQYVQVGVCSFEIKPSHTAIDKGYIKNEPVFYANLTDPSILNFITTTMTNNP